MNAWRKAADRRRMRRLWLRLAAVRLCASGHTAASAAQYVGKWGAVSSASEGQADGGAA